MLIWRNRRVCQYFSLIKYLFSMSMWAAGNEPEFPRHGRIRGWWTSLLFILILSDEATGNYNTFATHRNSLILIKRWKTTEPAGKSWKELATLAEEMRRRGNMRRCKLTHCFLLSLCAGLVLVASGRNKIHTSSLNKYRGRRINLNAVLVPLAACQCWNFRTIYGG